VNVEEYLSRLKNRNLPIEAGTVIVDEEGVLHNTNGTETKRLV
jgi:hypothetical protein